MRHFSFKLANGWSIREINWVPLKDLLPMDRWRNLQHFELSNLTVKPNDLANLLGELPQSIRSIELGFLKFFDDSGSFAGLLDEILSRAFWDERDEMNPPRLSISLRVSRFATRSIAIRVDAEIESFLYKQGMNPFRGSRGPDDVELGIGTERDTFNPECEWPRDQDLDWEEEIGRADTGLEEMFERSAVELNHIASIMDDPYAHIIRYKIPDAEA
ncbi:unnamed protein product [Clonostachys chloroleuca]|uniref:Uncharacterized protein n=1 Tax=Clonostachys chloroleuca TaxID=1926264 RepID=A0AA35LUV7_9HYPO|nr:unnamed protein product [Clonostachys chloroleuca]